LLLNIQTNAVFMDSRRLRDCRQVPFIASMHTRDPKSGYVLSGLSVRSTEVEYKLVGLPHLFMLNGYRDGQLLDTKRRMTLWYAYVNMFGRPVV
jgi:hypothetical protein